ncbi:hypothetical protein GCM10009092_10040 [Bowmanella denitrificans]|uniref:Ice-binding protein C-terminal domain-containing protein n=1 Tax=Bowmanella denitrificans TaxID=366582 RepID=A0ABN0WVA2_9ALTE
MIKRLYKAGWLSALLLTNAAHAAIINIDFTAHGQEATRATEIWNAVTFNQSRYGLTAENGSVYELGLHLSGGLSSLYQSNLSDPLFDTGIQSSDASTPTEFYILGDVMEQMNNYRLRIFGTEDMEFGFKHQYGENPYGFHVGNSTYHPTLLGDGMAVVDIASRTSVYLSELNAPLPQLGFKFQLFAGSISGISIEGDFGEPRSQAVPEPTPIALLLAGLGLLGLARIRLNKQKP